LKTLIRILPGLVAALVISACSSTPRETDADARKAAETNTTLAQNYMSRGQYEIALEKLKRAIAHDKTYAPAHSLLGILYETIGQTEDAGREYKQAVQYDPTGGDVNNNYGAYLCAVGRSEEADRYFLTAVDDPFYNTPEVALTNAGSCALQRGDLDKAETYLRQSLEYDDKLDAALLPMAEVSYKKKAYLRARAFLQRYEEVAPMTEESLLLGYEIETQLGDRDSARRYQAELIENYPGAIEAGRKPGREEE
jgi:type IV pilus assembly protein PilF